jgi:diguanylate cyclase (GGDEF)-like protein
MPNEHQLSEVLSEFARTMVTDFPIQGILDHFVERILDVLPVTSAGVTLISEGSDPQYVAASSSSALRFEELQTELGEGPCLAAYMTGEAVAIPDLRDDTQFAIFGPRALEAGLVAVFTFPLRHGEERLGALDLYRETAGPLNIASMAAAQTLADVAAAYLLNAQARTDLEHASDRSRETALHDALTGLPNRTLLLERVDHAMLRARRSDACAAVLFVDLDHFKSVNDQYGHSTGDELLVAVAGRLRSVLRPADTLARLSGDEFVILCEDLVGSAVAYDIAARAGAAMAVPFALTLATVEITASVGIAFSDRGVRLSERMIRDADTAMYQAKRKGGHQQQIVDLREQDLSDQRTSMERELRGAVQRDELRLEYQPIVATGNGRVTGVEALLRWDHPTRGLVMPSALIPLAERSSLITEIGLWVLEQACSDFHRWDDRRVTRDFGISVNVSAHQLMAPNFAATVAAVLADSRTDPKFITLELTESVFVKDRERAQIVLGELKALGLSLALDDFGTGYSSLSYLKQFPIDVVKVDQGFVVGIADDRASRAIIHAVIELGHLLDMTIVAEGVETETQRAHLEALGCDSCQGFFYGRSTSADDIDMLLGSRNAAGTVHLPLLARVG